MGNHGLLHDIIAIVSGRGESVDDRYISDIRRIAENIDERIDRAVAREPDQSRR